MLTMRAIQIKNPGPPRALQISKVIKPSAKKDGIVIKNEFIGINYVNTYYRNGSYSAQKLAITQSQIIDIGIYLTISLLVVAIFATVVTEIIKMLR